MNFLHEFTLFVVDIHQIRLISLFPTPFDHFHFHGSAGLVPNLILTPCQNFPRNVLIAHIASPQTIDISQSESRRPWTGSSDVVPFTHCVEIRRASYSRPNS